MDWSRIAAFDAPHGLNAGIPLPVRLGPILPRMRNLADAINVSAARKNFPMAPEPA